MTIDNVDNQALSKCQKQLGCWFKDVKLLSKALTHPSQTTNINFNNERLCCLGNSVLGLIITEYLFKTFPNYSEGELTKIKSVVVSLPILAKVGRSLNLESSLIVGKGLVNRITLPNSLIANGYQAIVGAIFLDSGVKIAKKFVLKNMQKEIKIVCNNKHKKNYKLLLQQHSQNVCGLTPTYKILRQHGLEHARVFQIVVVINSTEYGVAWGMSKKEASQKAAYHTLKAIKPDEDF